MAVKIDGVTELLLRLPVHRPVFVACVVGDANDEVKLGLIALIDVAAKTEEMDLGFRFLLPKIQFRLQGAKDRLFEDISDGNFLLVIIDDQPRRDARGYETFGNRRAHAPQRHQKRPVRQIHQGVDADMVGHL